jgi:hypothetical protein
MKRTLILLTVICGMAMTLGSFAYADFPLYVNYQGRLTDDLGDPVADGDYEIAFQIYNAPVDGDELWNGGTATITVTNGLFSHKLGPIPQYFFSEGATTYLAITVEGEEIDPRTQLIAVPYAFHSLRSDTAFFAYEAYQPDGDWVVTGSDMYSGVPGNVGIGTPAPQSKLHVDGETTIDGPLTVGQGNSNSTADNIVAGYSNVAGAEGAAALGGSYNRARGLYSVVTGGGGPDDSDSNLTTGTASNIAGGSRNVASGNYSSVLGGFMNEAGGFRSCVITGGENTASADYAVIAGGYSNDASGVKSFIAGGGENSATSEYAFAAGWNCNATGYSSFAMGHGASANHDGSFVWSDYSGNASSNRSNQFKIDANGGVRLDINDGEYFEFYRTLVPARLLNCSNGAYLSYDGVWHDAPKRDLVKETVKLDRTQLLNKIASLPIKRWVTESAESGQSHISPMPEDFHKAFGVGSSAGIAAMDQAGIALAAIQELMRKNAELEAEVEELRAVVKRISKDR